MKPKEKAESLVNDFLDKLYENGSLSFKRILYPKAKQCALICVEEIISIVPYKTYKETISPYDGAELSTDYWHEVRNEIEKL